MPEHRLQRGQRCICRHVSCMYVCMCMCVQVRVSACACAIVCVLQVIELFTQAQRESSLGKQYT